MLRKLADGEEPYGGGPFDADHVKLYRADARELVDELERLRSGAHRPDRASDVAAWLKRRRDTFDRGTNGWYALDDLLDAYRLHADTGTPLLDDEPVDR